jgi:hypothetical protein
MALAGSFRLKPGDKLYDKFKQPGAMLPPQVIRTAFTTIPSITDMEQLDEDILGALHQERRGSWRPGASALFAGLAASQTPSPKSGRRRIAISDTPGLWPVPARSRAS